MESKVYQGQSFSDKTVETTGAIENVVLFSIENNLSITDPLAIGTLLKYSGAVTKSIASLFDDKNRCATAITNQNHDNGDHSRLLELPVNVFSCTNSRLIYLNGSNHLSFCILDWNVGFSKFLELALADLFGF